MISKKVNIIFHIGLPKTASTYIQKEVWPSLRKTVYLGKKFSDGQVHHGKTVEWCKRMRRIITNAPPTVWMGREGKWLSSQIRSIYENKKNVKNIILSHEELFGRATHGIFVKGVDALDVEKMVSHIRYIKNVIPGNCKLKVVMVIRRQDRWLASAYSQCSTNITRAGQKNFVKKTEKLLEDDLYEKGAFLNYDFMLKRLKEPVGDNNLCVTLFEKLKQNKSEFIKDILDKIDGTLSDNLNYEKKNNSKIKNNKWSIRPNSLLKTIYRNLIPKNTRSKVSNIRSKNNILLSNKSISLSNRMSKKILSKFRDSNNKLEDNHGLEVGRYGYVK
jgi:hypothetical protein